MDVIVDNDDCDNLEIVRIMMASESAHSLCKEWQSLSLTLKITPADICDLERKLNTSQLPIKEAFHKILEIWRANNGDQATLSRFCDALKKCGFKDVADALLRKFVGVGLSSNKKQSMIPLRPTYYIPRTLSLRTKLRPSVFNEKVVDVFVFTGIERHELAMISGNSADVSTTQTKKVTERFIQLVHENDFSRIAANAHGPVHWIEVNQGKYYWRKSSGSLRLIHNFMHEEQITYPEKEFLRNVLDAFNNTPVCIGDTPGMGKSVLLASIAKWVEETYPERFCLFSTLQEILNAMETVNLEDTEFVQIWLLDKCASDSKLHELPEVELFLDAFDEVPSDQITKCKALLKSIVKLSNVRLYVTTRPHTQNDLEEILGVLGYTILPFNKENQIEFLCRFWTDNHKADNNSKLETFAKMCLTKLKENEKKNERDIAGIPLQCSLLAECYFYEAEGYSRGESRYEESIKISSMFDMFDQFMKRKLMPASKIQLHESNTIFARFKSSSRVPNVPYEEKFLYNHMHLALNLVFPKDSLKCVKNYVEINEADLFSLGILEAAHGLKITRFVHRTFAEFLIAEYLVHGMDRCSECKSFLIRNALKTSNFLGHKHRLNKYFKEERDMTHDFEYSVISYFVDCHLSKTNLDMEFHPNNKQNLFSRSAKSLFPVLSACTRNNLKYCFHLHLTNNFSQWKWDEYLDTLMLLAAIHCDDTCIMKTLFRIFSDIKPESKNPRRFKKKIERLLSIVFSTGSFKLAEFLLLELKPIEAKIVKEQYAQNLELLVERCLSDSIFEDAAMISNKVEILKYLVASDYPSVAKVITRNIATQFLAYRPHPVLIKTLFKEDTNVNVVDNYLDTILHLIFTGRPYRHDTDPKLYSQIFRDVVNSGFNLFRHANLSGQTALHVAVENTEVEGSVIEQFSLRGADFNAVDLEGNSILLAAVRSRSPPFISNLTSLFQCRFTSNYGEENALHVATKWNNYKTLEYLLDLDRFDVNAVNTKGKSPMYYAINRSASTRFIKLLIRHGANTIISDLENLASPIRINMFIIHEYCKILIEMYLRHIQTHGLAPTDDPTDALMQLFESRKLFGIPEIRELLPELVAAFIRNGADIYKYHAKTRNLGSSGEFPDRDDLSMDDAIEKLLEQEACLTKIFLELIQGKKLYLFWEAVDFLNLFSKKYFLKPLPGLQAFLESTEKILVIKSMDVEICTQRIYDTVAGVTCMRDNDTINAGSIYVWRNMFATLADIKKAQESPGRFIIVTKIPEHLSECTVVADELEWGDLIQGFCMEIAMDKKRVGFVLPLELKFDMHRAFCRLKGDVFPKNNHVRNFTFIKNLDLVDLVNGKACLLDILFELLHKEINHFDKQEFSYLQQLAMNSMFPNKIVEFNIDSNVACKLCHRKVLQLNQQCYGFVDEVTKIYFVAKEIITTCKYKRALECTPFFNFELDNCFDLKGHTLRCQTYRFKHELLVFFLDKLLGKDPDIRSDFESLTARDVMEACALFNAHNLLRKLAEKENLSYEKGPIIHLLVYRTVELQSQFIKDRKNLITTLVKSNIHLLRDTWFDKHKPLDMPDIHVDLKAHLTKLLETLAKN